MQAVLATGNPGKVVELKECFPQINWFAQTELGVLDIEETGLSFIENAILKARNAAKHTNLPALADDSGLIIDALDGRPGIYSARYANSNNFDDNINKVLTELAGVALEKRTARFCCTLAVVKNHYDPCPIIATGFWEGIILEQKVGSNGFGYDPIFLEPSLGLSAAEISKKLKNEISHRAKAVAQIKQLLSEQYFC